MIDINSILQEPTLTEWRLSIIEAENEGFFERFTVEDIAAKFQLQFEEELSGYMVDAETIIFWRGQLSKESAAAKIERDAPKPRRYVTMMGACHTFLGILLMYDIFFGPSFLKPWIYPFSLLLGGIVYATAWYIRSRKEKETVQRIPMQRRPT